MKFFLITDNRDAALGMRLAGIESEIIEDGRSCAESFERVLKSGDVGLILVTEGLYTKNADDIDEIKRSRSAPLITEIPDGPGGYVTDAITRYANESMNI